MSISTYLFGNNKMTQNEFANEVISDYKDDGRINNEYGFGMIKENPIKGYLSKMLEDGEFSEKDYKLLVHHWGLGGGLDKTFAATLYNEWNLSFDQPGVDVD